MSAAITWRLVPLTSPLVQRRCTRCEVKRAFASSDKFRVNAQQKRLDVWLIYKCTHCNATWNSTIKSRVLPQELDPELYQAFLNNDPEVAQRYAFDLEILRRNDVEVDPDVEYAIEGPSVEAMSGDAVRIDIDPGLMTSVRLGHFLKKALGISSQGLKRLEIDTGDAKLDKRMKKPVSVTLSLVRLRDERARQL